MDHVSLMSGGKGGLYTGKGMAWRVFSRNMGGWTRKTMVIDGDWHLTCLKSLSLPLSLCISVIINNYCQYYHIINVHYEIELTKVGGWWRKTCFCHTSLAPFSAGQGKAAAAPGKGDKNGAVLRLWTWRGVKCFAYPPVMEHHPLMNNVGSWLVWGPPLTIAVLSLKWKVKYFLPRKKQILT